MMFRLLLTGLRTNRVVVSEKSKKSGFALYSCMERIYIGTSGWVYKEWARDFYRGLKSKEHFPHYITQFPTVEINATFYRLPNLKMVHGWRTKAPPGFIFAVKGSR